MVLSFQRSQNRISATHLTVYVVEGKTTLDMNSSPNRSENLLTEVGRHHVEFDSQLFHLGREFGSARNYGQSLP
jgi:hypothetical protein